MLNITFKEPKNLIRSTSKYFDSWHDPEWFNDSFVQQMVLDVDKTEIKGPHLAISPVFGAIPPTKISGGVKALIMLWKTDWVVNGSSCGDNCAKWIVEISKRKDILLYLGHPMKFPDKFDAVCIDNGMEIHSYKDYARAYIDATEEFFDEDYEEDE